MYVTESIRNYIQRCVGVRIEGKYEQEKNESERIISIMEDIEARAYEAARQAAIEVLKEAEQYSDILNYDEDSASELCVSSYTPIITLKGADCPSSVHCWMHRMRNEIEETTQDISAILELGGHKDDLDRMLSEL